MPLSVFGVRRSELKCARAAVRLPGGGGAPLTLPPPHPPAYCKCIQSQRQSTIASRPPCPTPHQQAQHGASLARVPTVFCVSCVYVTRLCTAPAAGAVPPPAGAGRPACRRPPGPGSGAGTNHSLPIFDSFEYKTGDCVTDETNANRNSLAVSVLQYT